MSRVTGASPGRIARNAGVRAVAELVGKFATLGVMAVLARSEGPAGLGVFVLALAWTELAATPINMGFDRLFLRMVARDRAAVEPVLFNLLALKLARAVPVVAVSCLLLWVLGFGEQIRWAVYLLTVASLFDAVRLTLFAVFNGVERADLVARVLITQRLLSGALGLGAVLLGEGVVGVAAAYAVAAMVAAVVGWRALARHLGAPARTFPAEPRRRLRLESRAFAAQALLSAGMARLDAVLLSVLTTQAVVGLYGAAYRLLEATLFLSAALLGAFSAMYTYLHERSEPTIRVVFAGSLKLSLVLLVPCAVPMAVLPGPILALFFGGEFRVAEDALRLLAPTVVVLGNVMLTGSLIASRLNPRLLLRCFAIAFAVNVAANLAFIPALGATGAALAMLLTELVLGAIMLRIAVRAVGRPPLLATVGSVTVAGAAMAVTAALLGDVLPLALGASAAVYVAVLALSERRLAPADLATVTGMVGARLRRRTRGDARPPVPS